MGTADEDTREFDLEEFRALRQEVLQKVDAVSKLERLVVIGTAAVYAWLMTTVRAGQPIWFLPTLFALLGWAWTSSLGHQIYLAGQYLLVLENRLRPAPLPEHLIRKAIPEAPGSDVHGWEGFIRQSGVRKQFLNRAPHLFWVLLVASTLILPVLLRKASPP